MFERGFLYNKYQDTFIALITLGNSKGFSSVPGTGMKTKYISSIINYNITLVLSGKANKSSRKGQARGVSNLK